jgi:hypothetical protein
LATVQLRRGRRGEYRIEQPPVSSSRQVTLVELLDRILDKGVVLSGDITLAVADVDLVRVGLKALLASVESIERERQTDLQGPLG